MKKILILGSILFFTVMSQAQSRSEKICLGTNEVRGEHFVLVVTEKKAIITDWKLDSTLMKREATYPFEGKVRNSKGLVYWAYDMNYDNDGTTRLLVDEVLLRSNTKGQVIMQTQGVSFFQDIYLCEDISLFESSQKRN